MKKPTLESQSHAGLSRRRFVNSVATGAAEATVLTLPGVAAQPAAKPSQDNEMVPVVLRINDRTHSMNVEPRWTLQYVLRDRLGLTGHQRWLRTGRMRSLHRAD